MDNDPLIVALEAGLEANPEHVGILVQLAKQLKASPERAPRALALVEKAISIEPRNIEVLELAREIASGLGKDHIAASYAILLSTLDNSPSDSDYIPILFSVVSKTEKLRQHERENGANLCLIVDADTSESFVDFGEPRVCLDDVGGMENVKKRLRLCLSAPLQNPELIKTCGKGVRGGLLFYGPSGCGKKYIARALAGELGAKFLSIKLTDILGMQIEERESKLHEFFKIARHESSALIFIDELDALGQNKRQSDRNDMHNLAKQLLAEVDSIASNDNGLIVVAAANHPWNVDANFREIGRFDRLIPVLLPDKPARTAILKQLLKNKSTKHINIDVIAEYTHQFSAADLALLCNLAVESTRESSIESGVIRPLNLSDFSLAIKEISPSALLWFQSAANYAMFANESGSYDDLLQYIKEYKL